MRLTPNEKYDRALAFVAEWKNTYQENANSQSFWDGFFHVFGASRKRLAVFEHPVSKLGATKGRIDLLWKGTLLIEQKSRGANLEKAYQQAVDYFHGLTDDELPRYVLVCDFENFVLYDLETPLIHHFTLAELPEKIRLFDFMSGLDVRRIREDDPINQRAVEEIGELHDALKADNYTGEPLEVFLVRLLFCLFADDTGIFQPKDSFHDLIEFYTREDGSDVHCALQSIFQTLNEQEKNRSPKLAPRFMAFPYTNGKLFEKEYRLPFFDAAMRRQLLKLCGMNWSAISPAIFGAMFQTIIELEANDRRRQLGAHYTSEANILKLLKPLCFDELYTEFEIVKHNQSKLFEFHQKLRSLTFLDPACGCGNFLVIAYRELRLLEIEVLRASQQLGVSIEAIFESLQVNVDQFYGIEIEEFPAQIAQVAMWFTDHQMNNVVGREFGKAILRIPLIKSANIRKGNALEIDWADFVPPEKLHYIMGNPPFIGSKMMIAEQRAAFESVTHDVKRAGLLDFVTGWFIKAGQYISSTPDGFSGIAAKANKGRKDFADVQFSEKSEAVLDGFFSEMEMAATRRRRAIRCGFVATNSITQGEQVGVLWSWMLAQGIHIRFAHRTFQWANEAPGKAAVHCVIIGFGMEAAHPPRLFDYEDIQGLPHEIPIVKNINPYLVDAPSILLPTRSKPICEVLKMGIGNKPIDDGNYLFNEAEKNDFLAIEPQAKKYFKRWMGADELLNNTKRWCLWLGDCPPATLATMPEANKRILAVRQFRRASKSLPTQKIASIPTRFHVENMPKGTFLVIPETSSERRDFIPIAFNAPNTLYSNAIKIVPDATLYEFGILSSTMHNAWIRYTCGRLESRYRYSVGIVYNNYPWPQNINDKKREAICQAAKMVLEVRAAHKTSLAILYNPETMPPDLVAAHQVLDKVVDAAYGQKGLKTDAERVAFLFQLYVYYTNLHPADSLSASAAE